ncbi:MAG: protein translocase subunit SecF [Nanoarchaeota archaeon]|nr:protein translocase subunit SecF [Nanoarchaeota archaeon]
MNLGKFHNKNYKKLLLIPLILILASIIYLIIFNTQTGDFIHKDITLTGGTSITIYDQIDLLDLENYLSPSLEDLNLREIYDITTKEQKAVIIETTTEGDKAKKLLEDYLGYNLIEGENSDFEFTGSVLSDSFYRQLLIAILIAFLFMAIVVFIIFRTVIPSIAVIISAFADIIMTLAVVNILGIKMSTAGIIAFLLIIGYSVDTDILLTTRILKRKDGTLNRRIFGAFTTGITMTLTSLFAFLFTFLIVKSFSNILAQILGIVTIALFFDLLNTWITNVSILKWYVERKRK